MTHPLRLNLVRVQKVAMKFTPTPTSTPKKRFNEVSFEIISVPIKCVKTIRIWTTLKSSRTCPSKGDIIKKKIENTWRETLAYLLNEK